MQKDTTSPIYFVHKWRNMPEQEEETLDSFVLWLEYDKDSPDVEQENLDSIKASIDEYLGRNMKQIKRGESELLEQWIKAVNSKG